MKFRILKNYNEKSKYKLLLTVLKKDYATKTIFDESYINRVFGLLYLSYKFRDQCIIIKPQKNYFESKMLKGNYTDYVYLKYYEKNDDFNYIPDEFWNKIEDCMADKKRFIIIRIGIYFSKGAHANLLIYDTVNKSLERFEPHGAYHDYEKIYQNIDKKILQLFKFNLGSSSIKDYYKPIDYCPMKIFQALEKYANKQGDPGGFCAVWCLWYADLRLANPDLSRDKLVDKAIDEIGAPPIGLITEIKGMSSLLTETLGSLQSGLIAAIIVILLLIAANYQSFGLAIAVLSTVPAVLLGAMLFLLATGATLNLQSYMGLIMAVGVSVANAILIVTNAEALRLEYKDPFKAATVAASIRLRPILMTSRAMIAGMIPMASGLGEAGDQSAPLGRAVIGGLAASTLAALFIVPFVYGWIQQKASFKSVSLLPEDINQ